jgi:hypothetical protein
MDVDSARAEFSDVCRYFFGKKGEYVSVFFSIIVLFGGVIVYFVLMSNFLYYTGNIVYGKESLNVDILLFFRISPTQQHNHSSSGE